MHTKLSALTALVVAAAIVTGVASGTPAATTQRIAITHTSGTPEDAVLMPLVSGALVRDSGELSFCCWSQRFTQRNGQAVEIDNPLTTFTSKRGSFTWRAVIDWVDSGNDYSVGTGTWMIVSGTGVYKHLGGKGRIVVLQHPGDKVVAMRAEGLVALHG
jgi:hypothetical protein